MIFKDIRKLFQIYKSGQMDKRIIKKFFLIVGSVTGTYLIITSVITMSLLAGSHAEYSVRNPYAPVQMAPPQPFVNGNVKETEIQVEDDSGLFSPPARTNVLILGLDEVRLADVIIVGSFERDTGDINLLHIPRDTFTQIPEERMERMRENGIWIPSSGIIKINAMRSLGREFGVQYMQEQLSETLGIEFHYYVEIDLRAFREIVDLIGGVEIEVPRRMTYHDPYQNLSINIPPGIHLMDGRMAEHFVRYREYASGDIGRISAQQQFLTQLFRQALRRETVMSDPVGLARIALNHVQTDISIDLIRYLPYVGNLSPERIFTYTLPGYERRVHGSSFWLPDTERVPEVINRMFFGITLEEDAEDEPVAIPVTASPSFSRNARIAVLNGTQIGGVARSIADMLHMHGYQIAHVGPYAGSQENRTRINVRDEKLVEDLKGYFNNAIVRVDSRMSDDFDIVIIVGRSEQ